MSWVNLFFIAVFGNPFGHFTKLNFLKTKIWIVYREKRKFYLLKILSVNLPVGWALFWQFLMIKIKQCASKLEIAFGQPSSRKEIQYHRFNFHSITFSYLFHLRHFANILCLIVFAGNVVNFLWDGNASCSMIITQYQGRVSTAWMMLFPYSGRFFKWIRNFDSLTDSCCPLHRIFRKTGQI